MSKFSTKMKAIVFSTKKKIDYSTRYEQGTGSQVGTGLNPNEGYLFSQENPVAVLRSSIAQYVAKLPPDVRTPVTDSFSKFFEETSAQYSRFLLRLYKEFEPYKKEILDSFKNGGNEAVRETLSKIIESNRTEFRDKIDSFARDPVSRLWTRLTKRITKALSSAAKRAPDDLKQLLAKATHIMANLVESGFDTYYQKYYSPATILELLYMPKGVEGARTRFDLQKLYTTLKIFKP
jgi:hypothetical protein